MPVIPPALDNGALRDNHLPLHPHKAPLFVEGGALCVAEIKVDSDETILGGCEIGMDDYEALLVSPEIVMYGNEMLFVGGLVGLGS